MSPMILFVRDPEISDPNQEQHLFFRGDVVIFFTINTMIMMKNRTRN
jgi:hypothetical protein